MHRRHMIGSAACVCGALNETPDHLLVCPQYADAAQRFLASPYVAGNASLLLSDLPGIRRKQRKPITMAGTEFLLSVLALRPSGL
jgi:hypothetical protein